MSSSNGIITVKSDFFAALIIPITSESSTGEKFVFDVPHVKPFFKRLYNFKDETGKTSSSMHLMCYVEKGAYNWKELSDVLRELYPKIVTTFRWRLCDNDVYAKTVIEKRKLQGEDVFLDMSENTVVEEPKPKKAKTVKK